MTPTIGRIVHYRLSESDAYKINTTRINTKFHLSNHLVIADGSQIHIGNVVSEGQSFPMIIVAVHGDTSDALVNGQVFLDGNDTFWATSVGVGEGHGTFSWPTRS